MLRRVQVKKIVWIAISIVILIIAECVLLLICKNKDNRKTIESAGGEQIEMEKKDQFSNKW